MTRTRGAVPRGAVLGGFLLVSASVRAQDFLGATLSGDLALRAVPDVYLAPRLPSLAGGGRFFLYGQRAFSFRTRRGGATESRYAANDLDAGLDLPLDLGRRRGLAQIRLGGSRLDGVLSGGSLPLDIGRFEAALSRDLAPRWAAGIAARRRDVDGDYESDVLRGTFQGFGESPDIGLRLGESSAGATVRYAAPGTAATLGMGVTGFEGDARAVGNGRRLALPLDMAGREASLALDHPYGGSSVLGFHVGSRRLDGSDPVRREGGREVGHGEASLRNLTLSLSLDQRLANGGRLFYGIERATTRFRADGSVPKASDAGIDAPSGASVGYRATLGVGLTQAAFRWEVPQHRGRLTLGYRQASVRADASVGYAARLFLLGVEGEAGTRLRPTNAGVFDVAYERPIREFDVRLSLQQVVPYVFPKEGGGGSGGGGGGGGGSASRSDGGWTVGLLVGRRF